MTKLNKIIDLTSTHKKGTYTRIKRVQSFENGVEIVSTYVGRLCLNYEKVANVSTTQNDNKKPIWYINLGDSLVKHKNNDKYYLQVFTTKNKKSNQTHKNYYLNGKPTTYEYLLENKLIKKHYSNETCVYVLPIEEISEIYGVAV